MTMDEPNPWVFPPTEVYYVVSYRERGETWTLHYRSRELAQACARQLRDVEHKAAVRLRERTYRVGAVQVVEDA